MQHQKNADSVKMIKIQHFRPTSPNWTCLTVKWEQTFPANLLIVARYDYSKSQDVRINALKAAVYSMLILPKSKWIFFLWIERLVHIVQGNFWINPCDSVVDHWSKGWPYTPYILMRQSSGQNMHGQWLRDPVTFMPRCCQRPERKLALHRFLHTPLSKKSNNFSEHLLYSWSSKKLFCGLNFGNSSTCVLEVFRKRAGGPVGGGGCCIWI